MTLASNSYRHFAVEPIAGALGADVRGIDLGRALSDDAFDEVLRAFHAHLALCFRDQDLDPETLTRFARRFGSLGASEYRKPLDGYPHVSELVREANVPGSERNVGDRWHVDRAANECPPLGFALYCLEAPPYGGDTMFSNLYLAYEALSAGMQTLCDTLVLISSPSGVFGPSGTGGGGSKKPIVYKGKEDRYQVNASIIAGLSRETHHPLVRVHPVTGRKALFMTGDYSIRFRGMSEDESRPLIQLLNHHVTRPEFTCRFRWSKRSLLVMDNRCTQHYAINDYAGFRRHMLRVEINGDRPFGPALPRTTT